MVLTEGAHARVRGTAIGALLCLGFAYCAIGLISGSLAAQAATGQMRVAWRWAAWAGSGIAFAAHIVFEQVRLRSSTTSTALRVSLAAALGAFGLAVAANIHARLVAQNQHAVMLLLSLAIWPLMTALPAFLVALVLALLLARLRSNG